MEQPSKNGYSPRNNIWADFWGTLWVIIKHFLPVATL